MTTLAESFITPDTNSYFHIKLVFQDFFPTCNWTSRNSMHSFETIIKIKYKLPYSWKKHLTYNPYRTGNFVCPFLRTSSTDFWRFPKFRKSNFQQVSEFHWRKTQWHRQGEGNTRITAKAYFFFSLNCSSFSHLRQLTVKTFFFILSGLCDIPQIRIFTKLW